MDFARKQLEKYGWTDGKGLGKHENGISEALKPKLKRSIAGIGYDAAADFTEHWWSALYDKAASNVEVKEENGKTKKIKRKDDDDDFEITNSTWRLKKKSKDLKSEEEYSDFFVRTAVLGSGGAKTTKVRDSDSEDDSDVIVKMTDEELFAACEGRTAHKGARHGLRALGKLARIEQQEQMLLQQSKYNGYSHANIKNSNQNKHNVVEHMSLNNDPETGNIKKKKKKKKRCNSENDCTKNVINEEQNNLESDIKNRDLGEIDDVCQDKEISKKKSKKEFVDSVTNNSEDNNLETEVTITKKNKKKRKNDDEVITDKESLLSQDNNSESVKKSKKKKKK